MIFLRQVFALGVTRTGRFSRSSLKKSRTSFSLSIQPRASFRSSESGVAS
jgi:hypothetical protein